MVEGEHNGERRPEFTVLGPNVPLMLVDDHAYNGEAKPAPGAVAATGISGVFLEDMFQVPRRNSSPGIANVDTVSGRLGGVPGPPFRGLWDAGVGPSAIPKIGIPLQ